MIDPQQFEQDRAKLAAELQSLEGEIHESKLLHGLEEARRIVRQQLEPGLRRLREARYAFAADLDATLADLGCRLEDAGRQVTDQVRRACDDLTRRLRRVRDDSRTLELGPSPLALLGIKRCGDELSDLRADLKTLGESARSGLGDLRARATAALGRLAEVEAHVKRAAGSAVPLAAGESLYLAVQAEWKKGSSAKENPDGLLLVTDRRILMERKEKEGGFLGFGGKTVQGLLWDLPLSQVQSIRPEQRGLLGGVDLIHITPAPGAATGEMTVEVKEGIDADAFAAQVRKALDGSLEGERIGHI